VITVHPPDADTTVLDPPSAISTMQPPTRTVLGPRNLTLRAARRRIDQAQLAGRFFAVGEAAAAAFRAALTFPDQEQRQDLTERSLPSD
jgi:hypothetical protein